MRKWLLIAATLLTPIWASAATFYNYDLEKKVYAPFPGPPSFTGEVPYGKGKIRAYNFVDEREGLSYSVTIGYGVPGQTKESLIPEMLSASVQGNATSVKGRVLFQKIEKVGNDYRAVFAIQHTVQGTAAIKYSVNIYHAGNIYSWSVSEFPGISKASGKSVFEACYANLRIQ